MYNNCCIYHVSFFLLEFYVALLLHVCIRTLSHVLLCYPSCFFLLLSTIDTMKQVWQGESRSRWPTKARNVMAICISLLTPLFSKMDKTFLSRYCHQQTCGETASSTGLHRFQARYYVGFFLFFPLARLPRLSSRTRRVPTAPRRAAATGEAGWASR